MPAYELQADRNVMEIKCKLSGQTFEMDYRMPTNSERVAYDNAMTKRKGAQIKIAKDWMFTQAKVGARLCTGFKKGNFTVSGQIISSDPSDPDYCADWKNLIFKVRPDLFSHLCRTIFSALNDQAEVDMDDEEDNGTIENLLDGDTFDFEADDDAGSTPAAAPGAPEAAPAENPLS